MSLLVINRDQKGRPDSRREGRRERAFEQNQEERESGATAMRTGGWRRAFCTSVEEDSEGTALPSLPAAVTKREEGEQQKRAPSSRSCSKLSFFSAGSGSNSSTPRAAAAGIRSGTRSKSPGSQKLQCDVPPAVAPASSSSAPDASAAAPSSSSPRSSSKFAFFKHHSRSRCWICSQSLKPSQDAAVFTAECSHDFHFPCVAAHVKTRGGLACPVCSAAWSQIPFIPAVRLQEEAAATAAAIEQRMAGEMENRNPNRTTASGIGVAAKVYNDDEPLLLASSTNHGGALRFNPIPEAENEDKDDEFGEDNVEEDVEREDVLHGLLANSASRCRSCAADGGTSHWPPTSSRSGGIQVSVMPQAALISEGRRHRNYAVGLKVKAPPMRPGHLLGRASGRAPIDLVMVLDVSGGMTGEKQQMLKQSMRLLISSLGPADRLSMVAFSVAAGAKRLLPLRRMSRDGQRTARHIVDRLVMVSAAAATATGGATVGDALRKATKVLEDRRERNPVATVMLLSDATKQQQDEGEKKDDSGVGQRLHQKPICSPRDSVGGASATRFAHLEIPVAARAPGEAEPLPKYGEASSDDAFVKCIGGLVSVVLPDVHLQLVFPSGEISIVYWSAGGCVGTCKDAELGGGSCILRLGYLRAEEEREMLVELRVPSSLSSPVAASSPDGCRHHLSVKCNYKDPATQAVTFGEEQLLLLPPLTQHAEPGGVAPSSSAGSATSLRLRNLFISTRAVAESRRLAELSDNATAHRLLSSARALLLQSTDCDTTDRHLVQSLDAELADLQRRQRHPQPDESTPPSALRNRQRRTEHPSTAVTAEARGDPLTPTSAWRAAEQLAKVAIMRKSLNRVGDLHGFENARF